MPYRICKTFEIENGHMLSQHPDACRFPHGHSRRVECILEASDLDDRGMVCDFKVVKQVIEAFVMRFDHALCVNTADPHYPALKEAFGARVIGFEDRDPTTEVLARTLYDALVDGLETYARKGDAPYPLRQPVRVVRVRVWETSSSWAEYGA